MHLNWITKGVFTLIQVNKFIPSMIWGVAIELLTFLIKFLSILHLSVNGWLRRLLNHSCRENVGQGRHWGALGHCFVWTFIKGLCKSSLES